MENTLEKTILIIDSEPYSCEIVKFHLEQEQFNVDTAGNAGEALKLLKKNQYSLVLVDVLLHDISGLKIVEWLRKVKFFTIPIIFITNQHTEHDMLSGFRVGCDDYIIKPFSIKEVVARVHAVINRNEKKPTINHNSHPNAKKLTIDNKSKTIQIDEHPIKFTKTEFELLSLFLKNKNVMLSREKILKTIWSNNIIVLERTVDVHVARLRKKLGEYGRYIKNYSGYGYYFSYEDVEVNL